MVSELEKKLPFWVCIYKKAKFEWCTYTTSIYLVIRSRYYQSPGKDSIHREIVADMSNSLIKLQKQLIKIRLDSHASNTK